MFKMNSCTPPKKPTARPLKMMVGRLTCFPFKMVRAHRAHLFPSQVTKTTNKLGAKFGEQKSIAQSHQTFR